MEFAQVDKVSLEKQSFMTKWHSCSLAKAKVIFVRDTDPFDTIIIRNVYLQVKEYNKIFGLKEDIWFKRCGAY